MIKLKEKGENILIVTPMFNIELESLDQVKEMKEKISQWLEGKDSPILILDLENCEYIDSTGLGNIIRIFEMLRKKKGKLIACNLNNDIKNLFNITALESLIDCYESLDEALSSI